MYLLLIARGHEVIIYNLSSYRYKLVNLLEDKNNVYNIV